MAKTKGKNGYGSYSFKAGTPTEKFAFLVYGEYMETTAVSEGQARHAIKNRYNKAKGFAASHWVEMTPTPLKNSQPTVNSAVATLVAPPKTTETEKCLPPKEGIQYLLDLLAQK